MSGCELAPCRREIIHEFGRFGRIDAAMASA
jgi:hypothetical protein